MRKSIKITESQLKRLMKTTINEESQLKSIPLEKKTLKMMNIVNELHHLESFNDKSDIGNKIKELYNLYDSGDMTDNEVIYDIIKLLVKNHPETLETINNISKMTNRGDIDSGDALMMIMQMVEKIYP
jgi:hypothetical protein